MRPWEHPSNIHAAAGFPSTFVNFMSVSETIRQLSIRPHDLPSTSINFLSVRGKHFVRKLDLPLNFRQLYVQLRNLPTTFQATAGPSVSFHQHLYVLGNFAIVGPWDLPLLSVNVLSGRGSFCQLLSTVLESTGPSVNFRQIFVVPQELSTFSASVGPSVNISRLSVHLQSLP